MAGEETVSCKSVGIINVDWTNRAKQVSTTESLSTAIGESVVKLWCPDRLTVTELSNKKAIRKFEKAHGYEGVLDRHPTYYSYMYTGWKEGKFEVDKNFVTPSGRYNGILLVDTSTKERLLHVSVHLPNRVTRAKRTEFAKDIHRLVDDCRRKGHGIDHAIVAGDFNDTPVFLVDMFHDLSLAPAVPGTVKTTKRGRSIDNILLDTDEVVKDLYVGSVDSPFSHFPIASFSKQE
jgi:hypothetical protein